MKKENSGFRGEPFESRKYLTILESRARMVIGVIAFVGKSGFCCCFEEWVGGVETHPCGGSKREWSGFFFFFLIMVIGSKDKNLNVNN